MTVSHLCWLQGNTNEVAVQSRRLSWPIDTLAGHEKACSGCVVTALCAWDILQRPQAFSEEAKALSLCFWPAVPAPSTTQRPLGVGLTCEGKRNLVGTASPVFQFRPLWDPSE